MTDHPPFVPSSARPPSFDPRQMIYHNCRQAVAMAAGLEAMAVRAIESGEATEDQLERIALLSGHLLNQLDHLSNGLAELAGRA